MGKREDKQLFIVKRMVNFYKKKNKHFKAAKMKQNFSAFAQVSVQAKVLAKRFLAEIKKLGRKQDPKQIKEYIAGQLEDKKQLELVNSMVQECKFDEQVFHFFLF